jgi:hypothetical protein
VIKRKLKGIACKIFIFTLRSRIELVSGNPSNHVGDYPYLVNGNPSNHVGSVGYCLGTGPDLLPYKYKGVRPIENP